MKIKKHLATYFYYYIFAAIIIIVFWMWLFNLVSRPTKEEKLLLFIAANTVEKTTLEKELEEYLGELRKVEVDNFNPNHSGFSTVFQTRGLVGTDIVIVPEGLLVGDRIMSNFKILNLEVIKMYLGDIGDIFYHNDRAYGIKVYDCENKTGVLLDYIDYSLEENYYLLFNYESIHLGLMNTKSNDSDYALSALKYLFFGD